MTRKGNSGVEWESATGWAGSTKQLFWAHQNHHEWQNTFQEQPSPPLYSRLEGNIHQWTIWLAKEAIWDRFRTISRIACQKGDDPLSIFGRIEAQRRNLHAHKQKTFVWREDIHRKNPNENPNVCQKMKIFPQILQQLPRLELTLQP